MRRIIATDSRGTEILVGAFATIPERRDGGDGWMVIAVEKEKVTLKKLFTEHRVITTKNPADIEVSDPPRTIT